MACVYIPSWFQGLNSIILIVFLTAFITLIVILFGMKNYIQHNWDNFRCNPLIIPFAGFFGKNSAKNFTECLGKTVKTSSSKILTPWSDRMNMLGGAFAALDFSVGQSTYMFNFEQANMKSALGNVLGRLTDVSTTAQLLMMKIKSIFQKIIALYIALLYAAWSIMNGMKGIVKDPAVKAGFNLLW
jgi:hypothetical protein